MKKLLCLALALMLAAGSALAETISRQEAVRSISRLELADIPETPKGIHHYLLLCMDYWDLNSNKIVYRDGDRTITYKDDRAGDGGYSDGLVLVTLDENAGRVIITSFLRDTLMLMPDGKPGRINRIVEAFGTNGLMETINRHYGIRVEKFITVNLTQVWDIIDAVGGVDIEITDGEAHYLSHWKIPENSTVPAMQATSRGGVYHMDGFAAVIYMRIRKKRAINDELYDFGRTYRTRTVLQKVAESLADLDEKKAWSLANAVLANTVQTNLTPADVLNGFTVAFKLRKTQIESCRLPFDNTVERRIYAGGDTQLPDYEENRELLRLFMFDKSFVVEGE